MERTLRRPRRLVAPPVVVGMWVALVVVAHVLVQRLVDDGRRVRIPFPPLDATLDWRPSWRLLLPVVIAIITVWWAPRIARVATWRVVLASATVLGGAWAVTLALLDGVHGLVGSVTLGSEYLPDVARVGSPVVFLHGFVDHIAGYRVHVQGHPPGYLLVLWGFDQLGLAAPGVIATLEIVVGVLAIPAVLLVVRNVADETVARAAAPFIAVAPLAIWVATSADAFYMGVSAWAVALVVLATGRTDRRSDVFAFGGGLLFGATMFLSYGLVLVALIPMVVAWRRRRLRPLAIAALGAAPVVVAFTAGGFWWLDGLAATRMRYFAGVAARRPYVTFFVANLAAFAIALGPAIAVALARLRDPRLWTVVGSALAAVVLANLSGMSKGEVERIWLPFAIWILPAGAALAAHSREPQPRPRRRRGADRMCSWLAAQALFTIGLQTLVRSPW